MKLNNEDLFKTKNILYVEDDISTAEEVSFFLKNYIKKLYIAKNGAEGLKYFKENHIDLIITDIQMPIMDGLEMIRKIKLLDKTVPIMITTAFNETNYLIDALNLGVNRYIPKPINLKELIKNASSLLEEFDVIDFNYYLDLDANILDFSEQLLSYMGYTKKDVLGVSSFDFIKKEDIDRLKKQFEILKSGIKIHGINFSIKKKDDTYVDIILNATPIFDDNGDILKIHCELNNIDTYIKSEIKVKKALKKEHYLRELITIDSKIAQSIANETSKTTFLEKVVEIIKNDTKYEFVFISLDEYKNSAIITQSKHQTFNLENIIKEKSMLLQIQKSINKDMNIIYDIDKLPEFKNKDIFTKSNIHSIVILPIFSSYHNKTIGLCGLFFNKINILSKDEINMYKNIVETIALGIESIEMRAEKEELIKKLEFQVSTDSLTGTTNRRKAFKILNQEIKRANRYKNTLSLIYMDIDNFKYINDTYGHKVGDNVLISMSKIIQGMIRTSDTFARWGGEEFIIVLPNTTLSGAITIAEKFRKELEESSRYTASFGVTEYIKEEDLDTFVMRADKNMYKAKRSGKNRVVYE